MENTTSINDAKSVKNNVNEKDEKTKKTKKTKNVDNKLKDLFSNGGENMTYYTTIVNMKNGEKSIKLNENGYIKLLEFLTPENIKAYRISSYYIDAFNNTRKKYENYYTVNGMEKKTTSYSYPVISEKTLEYPIIKRILDNA